MTLAITAIYAAILALIILALGINVTKYRIKHQIALGDGGNAEMLRMIRLHGNAVEYTPLALILMAVYESNGGWPWALHAIGITLIVARVSQSAGMWKTEMPGTGRRVGQSATWVAIALLALLNLWQALR